MILRTNLAANNIHIKQKRQNIVKNANTVRDIDCSDYSEFEKSDKNLKGFSDIEDNLPSQGDSLA